MKKMFLSCLLLSYCLVATAQLSADRVIVGFGLDFTEIDVTPRDILDIDLQEKQYQTTLGYQLLPKLAVGLEFNKSESVRSTTIDFSQFSLNAVSRYYLLNSSWLGLYGEGFAGFGHSEIRVPQRNIDHNFNFLHYGAGAGLQFNFTPNIALDMNARYSAREDFKANDLGGNWSYRTALRFSFGVPRRQKN